MAEEKKIIRLADVGELEAGLKKDLAEEEAKGKTADILYCESISDELSDLGNLPTIDPKTLRPVAHWEEIPGSYEVCAGESGSWSVPATRCANPECGEVNPCGLKTPFCPMCGFRMEDVPYDGYATDRRKRTVRGRVPHGADEWERTRKAQRNGRRYCADDSGCTNH